MKNHGTPNSSPTSRFIRGNRIARVTPAESEAGGGTNPNNNSQGEESDNTGTSEENVEENTQETTKKENKTSVSEEKVETQRTVTKINSIIASVTKANVWVINQNTEYEKKDNPEETPLGVDGITTQLDDEPEPEGDTGEWKIDRSETTKETVKKEEWKVAKHEVDINESQFLGLWRNEYGEYKEQAPYVTKKDGGKEVFYKTPPSKNKKEAPIRNILNAEDWLYSLLERSETTQTHARIMKYLINFYKTGERADISDILSLFDVTEFTEGSYNGMGFDVYNSALFITDVETLKTALAAYSNSSKLIANAENFLNMQNTYQVNALFAAAVSITETSAGTKGNAVNGCNNWFNITGTNGPYKTTTNAGGETHNWRIYASSAEGINAFGNLIANGSYYYKENRYTVEDIAARYCPNTPAYPTQQEGWANSVMAQITAFYSAAGIDISQYVNSGTGGGGITGAAGEGYRGIYTTASGKSYVEYLQYSGPWAENAYADGTMHHKGCSVASVAVILSGFGIDKNPEDIRPKNGSMISIEGVLRENGLTVNTVNKPSAAEVLNHLNTGNPVIIYAGGPKRGYSGQWSSTTGHFFPVLEANGNQGYVSNVGSSTKTGWYDINTILKDNIQVIFISN